MLQKCWPPRTAQKTLNLRSSLCRSSRLGPLLQASSKTYGKRWTADHSYIDDRRRTVYKSLSSKDLTCPTEKTLMGHVAWLRQLMDRGLIWEVRWCDTRHMTADGHTKGSIDRALLKDVMDGKQVFNHAVKKCKPFRPALDKAPQ